MIAISIAHAALRPERQTSLSLISQALSVDMRSGRVWVHVERHVGPPHEWSERQWLGALKVAADFNASHCLLFNDDLILCPHFVDALERAIEARPNHIISLYNSHPLAAEADKRGMRWITSTDGLIGNAYVIPTQGLREFLEWRANDLRPGVVEELSEDQLINLWAMSKGALIWHTVPALVSHDETVPSCYGNKPHSVAVGPRDPMPTEWDTDALHIGRYFLGNHYALVNKLKTPAIEAYFKAAG